MGIAPQYFRSLRAAPSAAAGLILHAVSASRGVNEPLYRPRIGALTSAAKPAESSRSALRGQRGSLCRCTSVSRIARASKRKGLTAKNRAAGRRTRLSRRSSSRSSRIQARSVCGTRARPSAGVARPILAGSNSSCWNVRSHARRSTTCGCD